MSSGGAGGIGSSNGVPNLQSNADGTRNIDPHGKFPESSWTKTIGIGLAILGTGIVIGYIIGNYHPLPDMIEYTKTSCPLLASITQNVVGWFFR